MNHSKSLIVVLICILSVAFLRAEGLIVSFPSVVTVDYQGAYQVDFARYGLCQIRYDFDPAPNGLFTIKNPDRVRRCIDAAVKVAIDNRVNVLIFPELSMAFESKVRDAVLADLLIKAKTNDMIFIAGSFYDDARRNTVPIVLPTGIVYSYKIRQSKFEVSALGDEGMVQGDSLTVISSKYGKILPIVCVDLISDKVQFVARYLNDKNCINVLVNITYNPASHEFMREMSALVYRHRLFGCIVNTSDPVAGAKPNEGEMSYGNTSLFAVLKIDVDATTKRVAGCFKDCAQQQLQPAYTSLISQLDSNASGMIIVDLNLSTVCPPSVTNAPDQGYPTIRNLRSVAIPDDSKP
jgi:predicted amidohydrolase